MFFQILAHTPVWVFPLLAGLIFIGYTQSKERTVSMTRVAIVPAAMLILSLSAIWSTFGFGALATTSWLIAVAFAVFLSKLMGPIRGVSVVPGTRHFHLPGSWIPMCLILAIFTTRFVVGASLSMHAGLRVEPVFIAASALSYGLLSGVFLGRMMRIFRAGQSPNGSAVPAF